MTHLKEVCIVGDANNTINSPLTESDARMRLQQAAHILVNGAIRAARKLQSTPDAADGISQRTALALDDPPSLVVLDSGISDKTVGNAAESGPDTVVEGPKSPS